ncbi:uncharacterized protein hyls1 [Xenentodon cancila]
MQVGSDPEDSWSSSMSASCTSCPGMQQQRCFIKRKVLRKRQGQSLVCDESVYTDDSDAASCLEERLAGLDLSASPQQEFEEQTDVSSDHSDSSDPSDFLLNKKYWEDGIDLKIYEKQEQMRHHREQRNVDKDTEDGAETNDPDEFSSNKDVEFLDSKVDSSWMMYNKMHEDWEGKLRLRTVIRPVMSQQIIKKTDPVAKYFQYKQVWETFRLPGERDRKALRWQIKEPLAYQPKPRRVHIPNTYIVPTEENRSALRGIY